MELKRLNGFFFLFLFLFVSENLLESSDLKDILKEPVKSSHSNSASGVEREEEQEQKVTQTVLSAIPEKSSIYSEPVTFLVNVFPTYLPGKTPTGSVRLEVDQVPIATQSLINGTTKFTISTLTTTSFTQHYVMAIYSGDESYKGSKDFLTYTVFKANTSVSIRSWPNPSLLGQPVKVTVNMISDVPFSVNTSWTGSIRIQIDGMNVATLNLDANGKAVYSIEEMNVGAHTITAIYQGNDDFNGSNASLIQQVNKAYSITKLISSENPTTSGQSVVFTANVSSELGFPLARFNLK